MPDGIFTTNQGNGPWIEGCRFQGIGDDAVVLKNNVGFFKGISKDQERELDIGSQERTCGQQQADGQAAEPSR